MRVTLFGSLAVAASAGGSTLQNELQEMLTGLVGSQSNIGVQLGWKSASESFVVAAGSVTNPGQSSRAITTKDTFNYGSGTKAAIATGIFRMVDAGKIKLDDKVSAYVNPFLKRNNGTTLEDLYGSEMADATVLNVLRMEAGIPDFESASGSSNIDSQALNSHGEVFPPYAWMRAAAGNAVCTPGSCSFYSSNSYEVAGLLLTALQNPNGDWTDLDFGKAIGGGYPSMKLPGKEGQLKDTCSVAGFSMRGGSTTLYTQNPSIMGWTCGGMNANTGDFAKFFYDLLDESSPNQLVSAASRKEMTRLKPLNTGHFRVDYGAGLMDSAAPQYNKPTTKGPDDWSYIVGHIGETFAFHAVNGYMPKAKAAISIVTNTDAGFKTVDSAACKAAEIAAKVIGGQTVSLCSSPSPGPSPWSRRRRSAEHREASEDTVVV